MDNNHFDQIARSLATNSRRYALRALGGGALAGLLAHLGLEDTAAACVKLGKKGCKGPKNGKCCKGAKCKGGSKRKAGKCVCTGNLAQCGTTCVDTQTDAQHCGGCDQPCGEGRACERGDCVCSDSQTRCGTACVDTERDKAHCGGCGRACNPFETCTDGECGSPPVNCSPPAQPCDGFCIDMRADPNNCGSCRRKCETGFVCANSRCVCPGGTVACRGGCVDTGTNDNHCGTCGRVCASGSSCINGNCVVGQGTCPAGANSCVEVESCGSAGSNCACFRSSSGQTRCGANTSLRGPCGECNIDTDCAAIYPQIAGVFCTAYSGTCLCAGQNRCQAPCPS